VGTISTGPLASLTTKLARKYGIDCFVETGTFHGDAARFAATLFPRVVTIEIKREYQEQAILQSPGTNIEFLLGDSASVLPDVVAGLAGSALFWLDGHAGAGFYADEDNCPLLSELRAIGASPHPHVILVDDARAFLAPCPPPFKFEAWPTLREVLDAACCRFPYYCVVICDCIICVPETMRMDVVEFCNEVRPSI
jgi:hypothetical protein